MTPLKLATLLGTPVTTFLVVTTIAIEAVTAATGADVGPGIVGVLVGALAAIAALVLVARRWDRLAVAARHALLGYATFGLAFLVLSALSYVDVPGARQYLSTLPNVGIAVVVAVLVAAIAWWSERGTAPG